MMRGSQTVLELLGKGTSLEAFAKHAAQQMIALAIAFKLAERPSLKWRKLTAHQLVEMVALGVKFVNGIEQTLAA